MNHISMYSSSSDLRHGLHRVLAVSHSLTEPVSAGETVGWWTLLDAPEREPGRNHSLSLPALAGVFGRLHVQRVVDAARSSLGIPPLDHDVVQTRFRHSIISGKAHRAHMGRDVYGTSNKGLWDLVCADFGEAVSARYGLALGESGILGESGRPSAHALDALRQLTAFDTSPEGSGHDTCVEWLVGRLRDLGFAVEVAGRELGRPLVVAAAARRARFERRGSALRPLRRDAIRP